MHRLIQLSVQKWLMLQKVIEEWQEKALSTVSRSCPSHGEYEYWTAWEAVNPHIQIVKGYAVSTNSALLHRASMLSREAVYQKTQGRHQLGLRHVEEALAIREKKILGPNPTLTLEGLDCLSIFY